MEKTKTNKTQVSKNNNGAVTTDMKLRRLSLFSSGVGFFEHSGEVIGAAEVVLPFDKDDVNDALKSLVINDPDSSPTVSYHSENTLKRTLMGLSVDLSSSNHIAELLGNLKGAEIELNIPNPLKGRILLVECRSIEDDETDEREAFLSLLTDAGISVISLKEITGFAFTDPQINADITRALNLIVQSRDSDIRNLTIQLHGNKSRTATLSYVIPTPVWKSSYRLDLSHDKPFLQGWAIVDNDSDTDWEGVELALVSGKPVSFIQNLYAPYFASRPTLPLSIESIAKANTYDSGAPAYKMAAPRRERSIPAELALSEVDDLEFADESSGSPRVREKAVSYSVDEGLLDTATGRLAGEQFEFTIKTPVTLARQQSAMLPLVEGAVHAAKTLIFSGDKNVPEKLANPAVGAEIVNNTGMSLPAGPITVYDGGTYAGDALIEFFPEDESRLISYGEDLSVSGYYNINTKYEISSVSAVNGVMQIKAKRTHTRTYIFKNASSDSKKLIIEHPISRENARLITPTEYKEKTSRVYRFEITLPSGNLSIEIIEEVPVLNVYTLLKMSDAVMTGYISNQEIPKHVQKSLQRAVDLKTKVSIEEKKLDELNKHLGRLFDEQERTRKNLGAAGSQTQQGQNYLSRLAVQENEIDELNKELVETEQSVKDAQTGYVEYLQNLSFDECVKS